MAYEHKQKKRTVFKAGKFYDIDTIQQLLPGSVVLSMFRKPVAGEKTPDGLTHKADERGEMSDYDMCITSFAITVSILYEEKSDMKTWVDA